MSKLLLEIINMDLFLITFIFDHMMDMDMVDFDEYEVEFLKIDLMVLVININ